MGAYSDYKLLPPWIASIERRSNDYALNENNKKINACNDTTEINQDYGYESNTNQSASHGDWRTVNLLLDIEQDTNRPEHGVPYISCGSVPGTSLTISLGGTRDTPHFKSSPGRFTFAVWVNVPKGDALIKGIYMYIHTSY
jgi:hypothetical protein